ncbi:uncharacterized protein [Ptychodera flava]|uniref:uncharacterized protein n=1 Tax=Ptychodera flava TaxID=63121 RepID=UPI00396A814B
MVGIVLGVLFYKKRVAKDQSSNTDYANAGLDTSDYAEIPENNSSHRQETSLSEAIDIDPFQEITGEKFHPKSTQHVGRQNITSSRMTQAPSQKDVGYYEVALSSIGVPVQQSQSEPANIEQTQYASLQPTQPSEYQSLRT